MGKKLIAILVTAMFFVLGASSVSAGTYDDYPNPGAVADAAYVKSKIGDPNVVIVDARSSSAYEKGHIPGAINIPGKSLRTGGGTSYLFHVGGIDLPEAEHDLAKYETLFGEAGISNDKEVIVYGSRGGRTDGTVPYVILDMLGHPNVKFLDGNGMAEWKAIGGEVETKVNTLPAATFTADKAGFDEKMITAKEVLDCMADENCVILDTRDADEYGGKQNKGGQRALRGGHVPGAIMIDYVEFYREKKGPDYKLKPYAEIKELLESKGITPDKKVIMYCWTSTRIGEAWLALRASGYNNLGNYDHSMTEWNMLPITEYPMTPGNPYRIDKLKKAVDANKKTASAAAKAAKEASEAAAAAKKTADAAKAEGKGVCGPTALLALAMLPLGIRRLLKKD
jgi:thiosulfate/3-mercaptopyruvate sulfurtransferase